MVALSELLGEHLDKLSEDELAEKLNAALEFSEVEMVAKSKQRRRTTSKATRETAKKV